MVSQDIANRATALKEAGNRFLQAGDLGNAARCYLEAIALDPRYAHAYCNLGVALLRLERYDEARANLERALALDDSLAIAHHHLAAMPGRAGDESTAQAHYEAAIALNPALADAYLDYAILLFENKAIPEARRIAAEGAARHPGISELHNCLGKIELEERHYGAAVIRFQRALELDGSYVEAHYNLGCAFQQQERQEEAARCFRAAIDLKPDLAEAHNNLGAALQALGDVDAAVACIQRAHALKPELAEIHCNLGHAYHVQDRIEDAIACYRRALACKPDFPVAHSNLIFMLDLALSGTLTAQQEERRRWGALQAAHIAPQSRHENVPDPDRKLRVGYVSADLREHSAAYVFGAMLAHYDRERFEVFAYYNDATRDDVTAAFERSVDHWRDIAGLDDDAVADRIRADRIDLLVDLSGHSAGNRLPVFARKPAPIQITAWGYASSTGLAAMDVFFADPVAVPPKDRPLFVEAIRDLPNIVSYHQPKAFPECNTLPALIDGRVTFGSLNRIAKISDRSFAVWVEVLKRVPNSRFLLKSSELSQQGPCDRLRERFVAQGIDPARVVLVGRSSWYDHVATFNRIDIALDPFPHGGGVTALEGLRMGIPYVALRWPTVVGRTSVSILTTLGLTDWIAETEEQYIEIAARQTGDLAMLANLRAELRARFDHSIIGDTKAYVSTVENEYRQLWREWCAKRLIETTP